MSKFWIILFHTYIQKLKTKSFVFTTIITALILIGITNINNIISFFEKDSKSVQVGIIDSTNELYNPFKEQVASFDSTFKLTEYEAETDAAKAAEKEEITGYLLMEKDSQGLPRGIYKARSLTDSDIINVLQNALQQTKVSIATAKMGLTSEQIEQLYAPVEFHQKALVKEAKTEEELDQARGLVYILLFIIYVNVIMYGSMIAMEVATEKSSRVMEILVSSVSPVTQMFAKILGVALLSLTQLSVILLVGYASFKQNLSEIRGFAGSMAVSEIPIGTIMYAVLFFILGYLLFATLAAFLGSLVSRTEDVQPMITPMTLLIVGAFLIAMFGLGKPEAAFIKITSFIPFFTPMIMFLRVGMLTVPPWEIILSILLLVGTIILLAIFGARVYKGGVLMYGQSSSLKDIKKALLLTKEK
ncbi:ABC transporter permease [Priestia abyssalis]|uniref:ABC transporter permease n=1 Tax=Priestia abyssalis TaxID=1221450 RepID=UPI000995794F|nr:ABC transporter permease [Priestia abyssalis]